MATPDGALYDAVRVASLDSTADAVVGATVADPLKSE